MVPESIRQQKVSKLIQKEISEMLLKEIKHLCGTALVTNTVVRVTADLSVAKIYLSVFGTKDKESIINNFSKRTSEIRHLLGKRIRYQVKHIPGLHFYIDDSLDYIEKIDNVLKR